MTTPLILALLCALTAAYVWDTARITRSFARRLSMTVVGVVLTARVVFYLFAAFDTWSLSKQVIFSRVIIVGTLAAFTIQATAIRQAEKVNRE